MLEFLANVGYVLLFVNLLLSVSLFRRGGRAIRIFTAYLLVIFSIQIAAQVMNLQGIANLFLSHFYFIGQFLFLSAFYYQILPLRPQRLTILGGLALCGLALGTQYYLSPELFWRFNLFEIFITSFLTIIYAAFHFYNMLDSERRFYHINTGIMTYLFGSTVLFLAGNLVASLSSELNTLTWIFNSLLYIIYQIFVICELWPLTKRKMRAK